MRKIIIAAFIGLYIFFPSALFAVENALVGVKLIPLPQQRLRIDFQFEHSLKKAPGKFSTSRPEQVVFDFMNTSLRLPDADRKKEILSGALLGLHLVEGEHRVRAIFNLSHPLAFQAQMAGNHYSVIFKGQDVMRFQDRPEPHALKNAQIGTFKIVKLDFQGIENQGGRLVLDITGGGVPVEVNEKGTAIYLDFKNTRVAKRLLKRFDVRDFHSPANLVTLAHANHDTRIMIRNKGNYGFYTYQVNQQFLVDIFPLSPAQQQQEQLKNKIFSGKKISLNFQNIKVRSVLQLLADFTQNNMVVSDQVDGNMTLRLHAVPWDQALDIILRTNNLDKRVNGHVIYIDKAENLLKKEKIALESQKAIKNLEPLRSELIQVDYAKASDLATLIKDQNNSVLSKEGSVSVDVRTNTIWIQDTVTHIEEIRSLIKKLDVPVKQVQIEARIVDLNKNFERDLGIRWGVSKPPYLSGTLNGANQFQQGIDPSKVTSGNLSPPYSSRLNLDLVATPSEPTVTPASIGIALADLSGGVLLDLELSALESEGNAEIIASPRLITTNQQPAVIEAGQEIPYQEATSSGATAVAFKKAVLSLKVTPQITPDDRILMQLQINQDTPSSQVYLGVPAILTKEIQTTALVKNGQTIVLGGIYKKDETSAINRIPFLGGLPLVGPLFRNSTVQTTNEELLIFITPRIITNALALTAIGEERKVVIDTTHRSLKRKPLAVYK